MPNFKGFIFGILVMVVMLFSAVGGAVADRLFVIKPLDLLVSRTEEQLERKTSDLSQKILKEESVVIDVAERVSPSVVTVAITEVRQQSDSFFFDPFGIFGQQPRVRGDEEPVQRDIGTGFVVDAAQGLIVTNKHVVSEANGKYKVITKDDREFEVERVYRDPINDIAIVKISAQGLQAVELGESQNLKVGQFVIAIGTALGEFRHTVTTGVISGLGRGIQAGDPFGGFAEELDNVIQTDAAINPGNSGGPLLNSVGQVIGVNVAVAAGSENIGFAIPINVVLESLKNFNETGQFDRPFLGVRYRMISKETAILNEVPAGAYIVEVIAGSTAADAGIIEGDIITEIGGKKVAEAKGGVAELVNSLRVGETVTLKIYRGGETKELSVKLKVAQ